MLVQVFLVLVLVLASGARLTVTALVWLVGLSGPVNLAPPAESGMA